jgi:hypothetical protein
MCCYTSHANERRLGNPLRSLTLFCFVCFMSLFHMLVLGFAEARAWCRASMLRYLHAAVALFSFVDGTGNAIMLLYDLIQ